MKTVSLSLIFVCAAVFGASSARAAGEQSIVMNKTGKEITVSVQGGDRNLPDGGTYEVRGSWGFTVYGPKACIRGAYPLAPCEWQPEFRCSYYDEHKKGQLLEKGLYIVRFTRQRVRDDRQQCTITRYYPYG